jgi:hypothetical protein
VDAGKSVDIVYHIKNYKIVNDDLYVDPLMNPYLFNASVGGKAFYKDINGAKYNYSSDTIYLIITKDTLQFYNYYGAQMLPSAKYTIKLNPELKTPYLESVDVSQALQPNTADRFYINLDSPKSATYLAKFKLYFNKNNVVETDIKEIKIKKDNNVQRHSMTIYR